MIHKIYHLLFFPIYCGFIIYCSNGKQESIRGKSSYMIRCTPDFKNNTTDSNLKLTNSESIKDQDTRNIEASCPSFTNSKTGNDQDMTAENSQDEPIDQDKDSAGSKVEKKETDIRTKYEETKSEYEKQITFNTGNSEQEKEFDFEIDNTEVNKESNVETVDKNETASSFEEDKVRITHEVASDPQMTKFIKLDGDNIVYKPIGGTIEGLVTWEMSGNSEIMFQSVEDDSNCLSLIGGELQIQDCGEAVKWTVIKHDKSQKSYIGAKVLEDTGAAEGNNKLEVEYCLLLENDLLKTNICDQTHLNNYIWFFIPYDASPSTWSKFTNWVEEDVDDFFTEDVKGTAETVVDKVGGFFDSIF